METCVRQVITLPLDTITAETGRLLANIKTAKLDTADARGATAFRQDPSRYGTDWVSGLIRQLATDSCGVPEVGLGR